MNSPAVAIIVPCFNEEEALPVTAAQLLGLCARLSGRKLIAEQSRVYFVDDGSRDATWTIIENLAASDCRVCGVKLSRNSGHQNAILSGMFQATGDAVITVDADLQDDVRVIENMIEAYLAGADIVYGVRAERTSDTWFKRVSAELYYRLLGGLGVTVVFNHADFRLLSSRAVQALKAYGEVNLFLRGIIPTLGFPSAKVSYVRAERIAGESKYPLRKMLALAVDGVTSFSVTPLRVITALGLLMFLISLALSIWVFWIRILTQRAVPGWASVTLPIYLLGGIQLLSVGVLGEYIGKIYMETKRRPRYFVEKLVGTPYQDASEGATVDGAGRGAGGLSGGRRSSWPVAGSQYFADGPNAVEEEKA